MADPFDTVFIIDWSAASGPTSETRRENSAWVGCCARAGCFETHFRTRAAAEVFITQEIQAALGRGQRALFGFDFAMGYPAGFAARLTGSATAPSVWRWLSEHIEDAADNRNNRFAVASTINRMFPSPGPFWSHPTGQTHADLPARKQGIDYALLGIAELRAVEREARGAKSVWMLCNPGAVGSQSLLGLPMIHRLSQLRGVSVWPFLKAETPVVLAEVYPSLLSGAVNRALIATNSVGSKEPTVKDQVQVRLLARALFEMAQANALSPLFRTPATPELTEEGWILGAGHTAALEGALG